MDETKMPRFTTSPEDVIEETNERSKGLQNVLIFNIPEFHVTNIQNNIHDKSKM